MAERKSRVDGEVAARIESKISDLNVRELEDGTVMEIDIDGMPRTMFDRCWMPDIALVANILETAWLVWSVRQGRDERGFGVPVVAYQILEVTPHLYDVTFSTPLVMRVKLASFWEKGFSVSMELLHRDTRQALVTNTRVLAMVDDDTGKAAILSANQRKVLRNGGAQELAMKREVLSKPPAGAHTYRTKSAISDHDHLSHVNQSAYIRFCQDAAYDASIKGKLPSFPSGLDPASQQIQRVFITYKAQGFCGDVFVINVWETEPMVLCFQIRKQNDNIVVCIASIQYRPPASAKL